MLKTLFKDFLNQALSGGVKKKRHDLAEEINDVLKRKETQRAIGLLRSLIKIDSRNIGALTQLGICLAEVGETDEAYQAFELAHRLDDSNMEVAVNYASYLSDKRHDAEEAIRLLTRAQLLIPYYPSIYSVYAGVQLSLGNATLSREFSLRGWLASFDSHRMADTYLWYSAYADLPESQLTAEHDFWANTCAPIPETKINDLATSRDVLPSSAIRIGYWSPDFHDHSVRYFFRPLLEGHDRTRVKLILFHDAGSGDAQTDEIKKHCDEFHSVYAKTDKELSEFILSHQLDVLVELAGHTSHNRLWMLQARLAKLQITALGYPPTTGLRSIDAKCLDPYVLTPECGKYYTEKPLVLPESFWCFDPREQTPVAENPPVVTNGHVTFGCTGNIGKINNRIIALWAEIMRRVPKSRLILRSISFRDPLAIESMQGKLKFFKIDIRRVDLKGPASGVEFFRSYDEIDIVLDTFPFNGGTTTCFAVYMGVPVVTLAGKSLISRMGASVMTNVGGARWIATDEKEYVSKSVQLSQDIEELKDFRRNARVRMQKTSLGNGKKFANEFEDACEKMLNELGNAKFQPDPDLPILEANELIRRAATVMNHGAQDAGSRIVAYCLAHYPDFAGAHILLTDKFTRNGEFSKAANYLLEKFEIFDSDGKSAALINVVRFLILAGENSTAEANILRIQNIKKADVQEKFQADLYLAFKDRLQLKSVVYPEDSIGIKICCIIPCDEEKYYQFIVSHIRRICSSGLGQKVVFQRCAESLRIDAYRDAMENREFDIVVILQKNLLVWNSGFFEELVGSLKHADVVGYSGAKCWDRLDWRLDSFARRFTGYMAGSHEKAGYFQLFVSGEGQNKLIHGMAVLDGGLLAMRSKKTRNIHFDQELCDAGTLLEEWWAYQAGRNGLKVAVNRNLGLQVIDEIPLNKSNLIAARISLVERMKFEVFSTVRNDGSFITCPCENPAEGQAVLERYFSHE